MTSLKHEEYIGFVSQVLSILKTVNQYEQVFHLIVDRIVRMYKCQTCAVIMVNPKTEYLNIANSYGLSHTFAKAFRQRLATGSIGKLLWTGSPILVEDSNQNRQLADEVMLENSFGSAVCVQIAGDHRTLGYLHADCREKGIFTSDDLHIVQVFADFAALAVIKAELFEENLRLDKIDHETELEKHSSFLDRLSEQIERANIARESFALMILDVDNFKHIALTYGYDPSRTLLRELADLVKSHLRTVDAAGRHGFDEFIIYRENVTLDDAIGFADELRTAVEQTAFTDRQIKTTVSIGVSAYPRNAKTLGDLLLRTKEALYEAQRAGRNAVYYSRNLEGVPDMLIHHN